MSRRGTAVRMLAITTLAAIAGGALEAQSAFPMRFEDPAPLAAVQDATGAIDIESSTHYYNRIAFSGGDFETVGGQDLIRLEMPTAGTAATVELLVVTRSSTVGNDTAGARFAIYSLKTGDATAESMWGHTNPPVPDITWDPSMSDTHFTLNVKSDDAENQDLVTIFIEILANKPITVVEGL